MANNSWGNAAAALGKSGWCSFRCITSCVWLNWTKSHWFHSLYLSLWLCIKQLRHYDTMPPPSSHIFSLNWWCQNLVCLVTYEVNEHLRRSTVSLTWALVAHFSQTHMYIFDASRQTDTHAGVHVFIVDRYHLKLLASRRLPLDSNLTFGVWVRALYAVPFYSFTNQVESLRYPTQPKPNRL